MQQKNHKLPGRVTTIMDFSLSLSSGIGLLVLYRFGNASCTASKGASSA